MWDEKKFMSKVDYFEIFNQIKEELGGEADSCIVLDRYFFSNKFNIYQNGKNNQLNLFDDDNKTLNKEIKDIYRGFFELSRRVELYVIGDSIKDIVNKCSNVCSKNNHQNCPINKDNNMKLSLNKENCLNKNPRFSFFEYIDFLEKNNVFLYYVNKKLFHDRYWIFEKNKIKKIYVIGKSFPEITKFSIDNNDRIKELDSYILLIKDNENNEIFKHLLDIINSWRNNRKKLFLVDERINFRN